MISRRHFLAAISSVIGLFPLEKVFALNNKKSISDTAAGQEFYIYDGWILNADDIAIITLEKKQ